MAAETMPAATSTVAAGGAPSTVTWRVEVGAAWLDTNHPGWLERIDLIVLDMSDPEHDVIGQIIEGGWEASPFFRDLARAAVLGFTALSEAAWDLAHIEQPDQPPYPAAAIEAEYAELQSAWNDYVLRVPGWAAPAVARG